MDLLELLAPIGARKSIRDRLRRPIDDTESGEQTGDGVITRKQAKLLATGSNKDVNPISSQTTTTQVMGADPKIDLSHNNDVEMATDNDNFSVTSQEARQLPSTSQQVLSEEAPISPKPGPSQAPDETGHEHLEVAEPHLFDKETLVAENQDLKAYVIKTYFRRIKNFE